MSMLRSTIMVIVPLVQGSERPCSSSRGLLRTSEFKSRVTRTAVETRRSE